jgi:hypothetical protein
MDIQEHQKKWHGFLTVNKIVTIGIISIIGIMVLWAFFLI